MKGKEAELQAAVSALGKLTTGKVHVGVSAKGDSPLAGLSGISLHKVSGPHPAGNVGTLINKIDPVNKGEVVWTVAAQDFQWRFSSATVLQNGPFTAFPNHQRLLAMR